MQKCDSTQFFFFFLFSRNSFFPFLLFECFIKCDRLQEKLTAGGNAKSGGPCFAIQILWSTVWLWRAKNKKGGKKKKSNHHNSFFGSLLYNDVFIQYKLADVKANCIVYATLRRFFFFSICISSMSYAPAAEPKGLRGGNNGWAVVFFFSSFLRSSFTFRWWWWWWSVWWWSDANEWTNEEEKGQQLACWMSEWMECLILLFSQDPGTNPGTSRSPICPLLFRNLLFFLVVILSLSQRLSCFICLLSDARSLVLSYVLEYARSSNWLFPIPWRMNGLLPHRVALKRRRLIFWFLLFFPFIRP